MRGVTIIIALLFCTSALLSVSKAHAQFIKSIYTLYGKPDLTENAHFGDEGHDYGKNKRIAAYHFLSRNLGMDLSKISNNQGQVDESFVTIVDRKTLEYFKPGETKNFTKGDQVYQAFKPQPQGKK